MGVLDRIRATTAEDLGRPLQEVLGLKPGDRVRVDAGAVVVGEEVIRRVDALMPVRTVEIRDL